MCEVCYSNTDLQNCPICRIPIREQGQVSRNRFVILGSSGGSNQKKHAAYQGYNARKVNCSCVYSAYILKPVLSRRNL